MAFMVGLSLLAGACRMESSNQKGGNQVEGTYLLTFTVDRTPWHGTASVSRVQIWMLHRGDALDALYSTDVSAAGRNSKVTLWTRSHQVMWTWTVNNVQSCKSLQPPTRPTVSAVVTDSVGPILIGQPQSGFVKVSENGNLSSYLSHQGPIDVIVTQTGDLATRQVSMILLKSKTTVVREYGISFRKARWPSGLLQNPCR